jgi:hypothetical protein
MKVCKVEGCNRKHDSHGYCSLHQKRMVRNGHTDLTVRPYGSGHLNHSGYIIHANNGNDDRQHVMIAEKALGRKLPKGAVVHHVNGIRHDNRPENLVVCPDSAYHNLIHKRQRVYEACGHADWMKCRFCQKWDDTKNMYVRPSGWEAYHHRCQYEHSSLKSKHPIGPYGPHRKRRNLNV